ncbi:MAG: RHS repeat-associated core domain-containing protein [Cephaloticoccus sp.]|nr:RHS repeat-associated core domain-containing protein [Cephaloticoccus sp.]MCF7761893.1 RHS repeat-associated core domain-containing protein [Cephaloticoccus sp.]
MIVNSKFSSGTGRIEPLKPQFPGSRSALSGHRYYSPSLGRFINRDPIEEQGGINLYSFVGNDPVNAWDYLGMESFGSTHFDANGNAYWVEEDGADQFSLDAQHTASVWRFGPMASTAQYDKQADSGTMAAAATKQWKDYLNTYYPAAGVPEGGVILGEAKSVGDLPADYDFNSDLGNAPNNAGGMTAGEIRRNMAEFINRNPGAVVNVSDAAFRTLQLDRARRFQEAGVPQMSFDRFKEFVKGESDTEFRRIIGGSQDGGALKTSTVQFRIGDGKPDWGGNINYYGVGMAWTAWTTGAVGTRVAIEASVWLWNLRYQSGLSNVLQIGPGTAWAEQGRVFYETEILEKTSK